jgi:hypothetical protein
VWRSEGGLNLCVHRGFRQSSGGRRITPVLTDGLTKRKRFSQFTRLATILAQLCGALAFSRFGGIANPMNSFVGEFVKSENGHRELSFFPVLDFGVTDAVEGKGK